MRLHDLRHGAATLALASGRTPGHPGPARARQHRVRGRHLHLGAARGRPAHGRRHRPPRGAGRAVPTRERRAVRPVGRRSRRAASGHGVGPHQEAGRTRGAPQRRADANGRAARDSNPEPADQETIDAVPDGPEHVGETWSVRISPPAGAVLARFVMPRPAPFVSEYVSAVCAFVRLALPELHQHASSASRGNLAAAAHHPPPPLNSGRAPARGAARTTGQLHAALPTRRAGRRTPASTDGVLPLGPRHDRSAGRKSTPASNKRHWLVAGRGTTATVPSGSPVLIDAALAVGDAEFSRRSTRSASRSCGRRRARSCSSAISWGRSPRPADGCCGSTGGGCAWTGRPRRRFGYTAPPGADQGTALSRRGAVACCSPPGCSGGLAGGPVSDEVDLRMTAHPCYPDGLSRREPLGRTAAAGLGLALAGSLDTVFGASRAYRGPGDRGGVAGGGLWPADRRPGRRSAGRPRRRFSGHGVGGRRHRAQRPGVPRSCGERPADPGDRRHCELCSARAVRPGQQPRAARPGRPGRATPARPDVRPGVGGGTTTSSWTSRAAGCASTSAWPAPTTMAPAAAPRGARG